MLEESSTDSLTTREMNKWVLEESKPEISLTAKMTKTETVLLQAHHESLTGFFGADNMLGKTEGSRKRERSNIRSIDSIKESIR